MTELLLLRHGKAESHDTGTPDHGRNLTTDGQRDARAIGLLLRERGLDPDVLLCSDSSRTMQTADLVLEALGKESVTRYSLPELYLADPRVVLDAVDIYANGSARVLVVGHNPGLEELASAAAGEHTRLKTAWLARIERNADGLELKELLDPRV
jgi:phosphohistidine phosphatase